MGGTFVFIVVILCGTVTFLHRLPVPVLSVPKKTTAVLSIFILGISSQMIVKATDYLPVRIAMETKDALKQYKEYGRAKAQREAQKRAAAW